MTAQDRASADHGPSHRRASPGRRRRAAPRRGRSGTRSARRRRQCARGHGRDGGDHRRRLSAHDPPRRRRLLAGARAVGARARADGGWPRRRQCAARALPRLRNDPAARRARGAHRPGAVAGWILALEAASAHGGRLRLGDLLAPAIAHAREGTIVTRSQARFTAEKLAELEDVPGFAPTFLLDGKPPEAGATLKQAALAATLDHLAHAGLDDFYRGDVGREIAGDLDRVGSPVTRADLERCRATLAEPLSVTLDAGRAFNTPPPTQGLASLIILALFERLRIPQGEGFDHIHTLVEATKRAFGVRDRVITDPDDLPHPVDRYLDAKFLDAEARTIDRRKAA